MQSDRVDCLAAAADSRRVELPGINGRTVAIVSFAGVMLVVALVVQAQFLADVRTCWEHSAYSMVDCISPIESPGLFDLPELGSNGRDWQAVLMTGVGAFAATICLIVGARRMRRLLGSEAADT